MLKGLKKMGAVLVIILLIIPQTLFALDGTKPSQWAEAEISQAIENRLVPQQLQSNYQKNIKRYEYVLLALEVFDMKGRTVTIPDTKPFTDTAGHRHEPDIIKAYYAGIVKGDGKGNFHPDDNITREEIASLVVNLLKQISPDRDYKLKSTYPYNDRKKISDWATYYIDYCYENKILNGYGGNMMDPKGNATIEQSIALLYRLAKTEHLLESAYGTIEVTGENVPTAQIIDEFVENYDINTFNTIKELSKDQNIGIMSLWAYSTTLSVNDNTISLNNPEDEKNIVALINTPVDPLLVSTYKKLLATYDNSEKAAQLLDEHYDKMKAGEEIDFYTEIDPKQTFRIRTYVEGSKISYMVSYIQIKN